MKAELRKVHARRADAVRDARQHRETTIAAAKNLAAAELGHADREFEKRRDAIRASYEARASERAVAAELSAA